VIGQKPPPYKANAPLASKSPKRSVGSDI